MHDVLRIVHLLAAAVWLGGTVALVFAGVPAIRTLEGAERGRAMRELGGAGGRGAGARWPCSCSAGSGSPTSTAR